MKIMKTLVLGTTLLASVSLTSFAALAKDITVGVSWSNFQEERWKTDEAAIKQILDKAGAKYISADAQVVADASSSPTSRVSISKGANVLMILAIDNEAILPAVKKATDEGIPVIAYDRLIESPNVLYITFNNVEVGRMMAKAIEAVKPAGNYAFIKGDKGDPNADFLFSGIKEVLGPAMAAGKIKNVGESYTDNWKPDNAQKNMEQILTKNNNKVDAVVARTTAWRAASWPPSRRREWRVPFPCRVRTATTRRSTELRSALRPCRSGRTRAISAMSPPKRRSTSPRARRRRPSKA